MSTFTEQENGMNNSIGSKRWAIAEGYIPPTSHGPEPVMTSHETACLLNTSGEDAHVQITIYFADRDPVGPYSVLVPARRTNHVRFNDLKDPAPIPRGTDYATVIESDIPIVVQHTRLDSRQNANALLSTRISRIQVIKSPEKAARRGQVCLVTVGI